MILGALCGVLPTWPDYVFNCSHGDLGGGRYGLVQHELMEVSADENGTGGSGIRMNGSFHSPKRGSPPGWKKRMIPGARFIGLFEPKNEPFAAFASWLPTTTVAVRVPEAALVGTIRLRSADRVHLFGSGNLEQYGLPQFSFLDKGQHLSEEARVAILAGDAGRWLAAVRAPYVSLSVHDGQLALTRNGFVMDEALDQLIAQAVAIAMHRRCVPGAPATAPFADPLGVVGLGPTRRHPPGRLGHVLDTAAVSSGWCASSLRLPRRVPRLPVPAAPRGSAHPAGRGLTGRLAFHQQGGIARGTVRGAALFAARRDADGPLGGAPRATDMYVEVSEGIVCCWNRVRTPAALEAADLAARAQATVRTLGLV